MSNLTFENLNIPASRHATNITLPETLLREARAMDISISKACERGLIAAVAEKRREQCLAENRGAISAWNEFASTNELPLAGYRQF